jgi:LysM repeat protein
MVATASTSRTAAPLRTAMSVLLGLVLVLLMTGNPAAAQEASPDSAATYTVQDGDTLYGIARQFGTSVRALMRWNDLDAPSIRIGQTLRVRPPRPPQQTTPGEPEEETPENRSPENRSQENRAQEERLEESRAEDDQTEETQAQENQAQEDSPAPDAAGEKAGGDARSNRPDGAEAGIPQGATDSTRTASTRTAPGRLTARSGDTLVDIALRLGTTADTLFAMNDSLRAPLTGGETVLVPPRFGAPTHVVAEGETLYSIAGAYGVSVRALKAENDLEDATIQPGQRLAIPGGVATSSTPPPPDSTGAVAIYPPAFAGRLTASGDAFDPDAFVGSHPTLPYGSVVLLSVPDTRAHCFVEIVDRGPVEDNVIMDVSDAVASQLGLDPNGNTAVQLRIVWQAK